VAPTDKRGSTTSEVFSAVVTFYSITSVVAYTGKSHSGSTVSTPPTLVNTSLPFNNLRENGMQPNVDLMKTIKKSKIFLHVSTANTFPTLVVEALNMQTPVICKRTYYAEKLLGKTSNFIYDTVEELYDCLVCVLEYDNDHLASLLKKQKSRVGKYSMRETVDMIQLEFDKYTQWRVNQSC